MSNIYYQNYIVNREQRNKQNSHGSFLILFTGLFGAGKSTIAAALDKALHDRGIRTYALDGDNIRLGISQDLNFNKQDREENLRRVGEITKLFIDACLVTLAAFVAPSDKSRNIIKSIVGVENYIEVFVSTPIEVCEKRDAKGLYAKARAGEIANFTGVSAPYEKRKNPDLNIDCSEKKIETAVTEIMKYVNDKIKLSNDGC